MFRLDFTVDVGSMSGDYKGYFADGTKISGEGFGSEYVTGDTAGPIGPKPTKTSDDSGSGDSGSGDSGSGDSGSGDSGSGDSGLGDSGSGDSDSS